MKLAIVSDLHVGKKQYRTDENNYNKYEQIGYRALRDYLNIIKKEKPDLVINAGDTFETANPSVLAMTNYFNFMRQLEKFPTMTILGNHDFNFANRRSGCSAVGMIEHTYFADYKIKSIELDDTLFVLMPYIYDTAENISQYLKECEESASSSTCSKKILITHGVTERYYKNSLISDPIMLSDHLVSLFDLVIIGHIHTPYNYFQGKTLVISPGAMIDYQAYEDRTGPIILDTETMKFEKIKVKTPHIIKKNCTDKDINSLLANVTEDIYHISYEGNVDSIDNDLFIAAKNKAVNLVIDVIKKEEEVEDAKSTLSLNIYDWVAQNYPDYSNTFTEAREAMMANGSNKTASRI